MQKNITNFGAHGIMLVCLASANSYAGGFAGGISTDNKINKIVHAHPSLDQDAKGLVEAVTGYDINNFDFMQAAKLRAGGRLLQVLLIILRHRRIVVIIR